MMLPTIITSQNTPCAATNSQAITSIVFRPARARAATIAETIAIKNNGAQKTKRTKPIAAPSNIVFGPGLDMIIPYAPNPTTTAIKLVAMDIAALMDRVGAE
jgi:hypothetical protein